MILCDFVNIHLFKKYTRTVDWLSEEEEEDNMTSRKLKTKMKNIKTKRMRRLQR